MQFACFIIITFVLSLLKFWQLLNIVYVLSIRFRKMLLHELGFSFFNFETHFPYVAQAGLGLRICCLIDTRVQVSEMRTISPSAAVQCLHFSYSSHYVLWLFTCLTVCIGFQDALIWFAHILNFSSVEFVLFFSPPWLPFLRS